MCIFVYVTRVAILATLHPNAMAQFKALTISYSLMIRRGDVKPLS
jgi:hypothetical protein